jgi:hypothetical protein
METIPFDHYFPNMFKGWINYVLSAVSPHFPKLEKCALHAVHGSVAASSIIYASTVTLQGVDCRHLQSHGTCLLPVLPVLLSC